MGLTGFNRRRRAEGEAAPVVASPRPASGDNKAAWAAHAEALGIDVKGFTKGDIVAAVDAHEAEAEAQVAADAAALAAVADAGAEAATEPQPTDSDASEGVSEPDGNQPD